MAFREVSMVIIREILRRWLRGDGLRPIAEQLGVDRKTVRRYVETAEDLQVRRDGGEEQLTDEVLGAVVEKVRPTGRSARGESWLICEQHRTFIQGKLNDGCNVAKAFDLLRRKVGAQVARRTFQRFVAEELGGERSKLTVRLADPAPGQELQVDFGRLGPLAEVPGGVLRVVFALVMTACYSRHQFVWLGFRQQVGDVIAGLEAGWRFFGGIFAVLIPDNLEARRQPRRSAGAAAQRGVCALLPESGLRRRPGSCPAASGQGTRRARRTVRAPVLLRWRALHRSGGRSAAGRAVVP